MAIIFRNFSLELLKIVKRQWPTVRVFQPLSPRLISFATDLAASFGCRIIPQSVSKLLLTAIWSHCAVWLESEALQERMDLSLQSAGRGWWLQHLSAASLLYAEERLTTGSRFLTVTWTGLPQVVSMSRACATPVSSTVWLTDTGPLSNSLSREFELIQAGER